MTLGREFFQVSVVAGDDRNCMLMIYLIVHAAQELIELSKDFGRKRMRSFVACFVGQEVFKHREPILPGHVTKPHPGESRRNDRRIGVSYFPPTFGGDIARNRITLL